VICGAALLSLLTACIGVPDGVTPVTGFELPRYLGTWYEIARLDHSFERDLTEVTAEYVLRDGGGVTVINRGRDKQGDWQEARGKAFFVKDETTGHLKVSFFGPFYGSYVIFELDHQDYQHAFVAGFNKNYLWLLARTPQVSEALIQRFINQAGALGFDTDALIFVDQTPIPGN
jgi:apolipoprotein D and lipocalin family protein